MMEKRNVVEEQRTPDHEITRADDDWDKTAAASFIPLPPGSVRARDTKDLTSLTVHDAGPRP
jgi:hypothetical protein